MVHCEIISEMRFPLLYSPKSGKRISEIINKINIIDSYVINDEMTLDSVFELVDLVLIVIPNPTRHVYDTIVYLNLSLFGFEMFSNRRHEDVQRSVNTISKRYKNRPKFSCSLEICA